MIDEHYEITEDMVEIIKTPDNDQLISLNIDSVMLKRILKSINSLDEGMNHVHIQNDDGVEVLRIRVMK